MTYEERIIRGAMERSGIPNRNALSDQTDINDQTMRKRLRRPEKITIGELRRIADVTQMTREEKLSVLEGERNEAIDCNTDDCDNYVGVDAG